MKKDAIQRYLKRHGVLAETESAVRAGLRACVVIPAKAERENLPTVLDSLSPLPDWAEVIVVLNNGVDAPFEVVQNNRETAAWLDVQPQVVVIDQFSRGREILEGGVGRARRIGMDTALARLVESGGVESGFIACLDADSPVDSGYCSALDAFFAEHPDTVAGVCHFEHQRAEDPVLDAAIVAYEIWLRYWEEGLRSAGSPYAFQNVGSCMVASAAGYAAIDGMPQLSSAQDFYFLEKAVKHGGPGAVRTIVDATVRPSARPSRRVPHGTGRAVADIMDGRDDKYLLVPPASVFYDLGELMDVVDALFEADDALDLISSDLVTFIEGCSGGLDAVQSMRDTAPDAARFARSFHAWFSASRQIQFANEVGRRRGLEDCQSVCRELIGNTSDSAVLLDELRARAQNRPDSS